MPQNNKELLAELVDYCSKIESILERQPDLYYQWKEGGPNVSQITFHTAKAIHYWVGELVLEIPSHRNRNEEFNQFHSQEEILASFQKCKDLFEDFYQSEIHLDKPIKILPENNPSPGKTWNVLMAILHITAHTAEHYGQLKFINITLQK